MNKETYNLIISDIIVSLLDNKVPSDEIVDKYVAVFENGGISNKEIWYSGALRYFKNIIPNLLERYTREDVEKLVEDTLIKYNARIAPLNITMFKSYLMNIHIIDKVEPMTHAEKIDMLEGMLNCGPINNCLYEAIIHNKLLPIYLNDPETYFVEIARTSKRLKELIEVRNLLPVEISRP